VHLLLARTHKRLRDTDAALSALHTALDLQTGHAERAATKAAIDRIDRVHLTDDEEEEEL
jgi:hypothetical protein